MVFREIGMKFFAAFVALTLSMPAFADQWTAADAAYAAREDSRPKIAEARTAYAAILNAPATNAQDKLRAATQLGRLAIYEGEMLLAKSDTAGRKAVFRDCWDKYMVKIAPATNVGASPNYFYFKGVCLAYWGEAAGTLASLPHVGTLLDMIEKGLAADTRFEGGGVYRLAAGVYSNRKAQALGIYDPNKALDMIDKALGSAAYPGDPNSGAKYFENWRGKGTVLVELEKDAEAKTTYATGLQKIADLMSDDELPAGRTPETMWCKSIMTTELDALN